MANEEQLALLKAGVDGWNIWRKEALDKMVDLSEADLSRAKLQGADLKQAYLVKANLSGANFEEADLTLAKLDGCNLLGANLQRASLKAADLSLANLFGANLSGAYLRGANLHKAKLALAKLKGTNLISAVVAEADLSGARLDGANLLRANLRQSNLEGANLSRANLSRANLSRANLSHTNLSTADLSGADLSGADCFGINLTEADLFGADLRGAHLVHAKISNAKISKSTIYGISVWDLIGEFKEQKDLVITPWHQPSITVDNIKVAQFIYLILNNQEIREVINTLTSKSVLILGRFAIPERKAILDALKNKLREYNLLPIVFDFERPTDKDFTETIKTLVGISYFVIADVTNPKSSPLELQATIPDYQIPFVPIIQEGEQPFSMMADLQQKYSWVLNTRTYDSIETLMKTLKPRIIDPAIEMRNRLRLAKAQEQVTESLKDYLDKSI